MIRGLLCDVHGVLYTYPDPVPGSVRAVRRLEEAGFPHVFLTNTSLHPKAWILKSLEDLGFTVRPEHLVTAVEAAGDHLRGRGHQRIGWLCVPALLDDLPGFEVVSPEGEDTDPVDAVLIGDLGEGFTYRTLTRAFRWLHDGAELVAVARNRYYQTPDGLTLDSGPFVSLLEFAAETEARVVGKPSPAFFRAGARRLHLDPPEIGMIGDDFQGDVLPAMELGMRGIQVKTGKFRADRYAREPREADLVVEDLDEAVDRILGGSGLALD